MGGVAALGLIGLGAFYLLRGRGPGPARLRQPRLLHRPAAAGGGGAGGAGPPPLQHVTARTWRRPTRPRPQGRRGRTLRRQQRQPRLRGQALRRPTASLAAQHGRRLAAPQPRPMAQDLAYMQHAYNNNAAAAGEVPPQQQQEHYSGHYAGPYADPLRPARRRPPERAPCRRHMPSCPHIAATGSCGSWRDSNVWDSNLPALDHSLG